MSASDRQSIIGIVGSVVIGTGVALAGSDGSVEVGAIPVFAICAALAFAVNWVAFVLANRAQTERYYDLTGSLTYLSVVALALLLSPDLDARAVVVAVLVAVWALRLGTFLFRRISADGGDGRFDTIKVDFKRFLMSWSLQALWVLFTASAALAVITSNDRRTFDVWAVAGLVLWIVGFTVEVVADQQKRAFRRDSANEGRFITSGLWAWSRHPNYFGEITLWAGVAVMAVPLLSGWRWVVLISPVFVYVLLTRISGVPLLEHRARKRWGDDPEWQAYTARTPVLVPRPPR